MTTPVFKFRLKFTACAAALACAMVLSVAAYARGGGFGGGGGFPLFASDNFNSQQNGIFRHKVLAAILNTTVIGDHLTFRIYHAERQSLTGPTFINGILDFGGASPIGNLDTNGARAGWTHYINPDLPVSVFVGYRTTNVDNGKAWTLMAQSHYRITPTLIARLRFESIYHDASAGRGFSANVISIALTKTFE